MNKLQHTMLASVLCFSAALAANVNVKFDLVHEERVAGEIVKQNVSQHIVVTNGVETIVYDKEDGLNIAVSVTALDTQEDVDAAINPNGTELGWLGELGEKALVKFNISSGAETISQPVLIVTWGEEARVKIGEENGDGNTSSLELTLVVTR